MTVLWIILGVIAAIVILLTVLLHFSVKAYIEGDLKHFSLVVKYFGFTLYKLSLPNKTPDAASDAQSPSSDDYELSEIPAVDSAEEPSEPPEEPAAEPDRAEQSPSEEEKTEETSEDNSETSEEEKPPKPTLLEQFNEYKKYIPAGKKAFRKLLKLIRFYGLRLELKIGSDDPYKAGLNFGRVNAVFYNVLALLCCIFSVKIDKTEITCDFENKVTELYYKTAIYVRPSAVIALAAYVGIYYLKIRKSMKKLENKAKEKTK